MLLGKGRGSTALRWTGNGMGRMRPTAVSNRDGSITSRLAQTDSWLVMFLDAWNPKWVQRQHLQWKNKKNFYRSRRCLITSDWYFTEGLHYFFDSFPLYVGIGWLGLCFVRRCGIYRWVGSFLLCRFKRFIMFNFDLDFVRKLTKD